MFESNVRAGVGITCKGSNIAFSKICMNIIHFVVLSTCQAKKAHGFA